MSVGYLYRLLLIHLMIAPFAVHADGAMVSIGHRVLDESGLPVPGVRIQVYRAGLGRAVATTSSGGDGQFGLALERGANFRTITFEHSLFDPDVIDGLSGEHSHDFTKILRRRGSATAFDDIVRLMSTIHRVYELRVQSGDLPEVARGANEELMALMAARLNAEEWSRQVEEWIPSKITLERVRSSHQLRDLLQYVRFFSRARTDA